MKKGRRWLGYAALGGGAYILWRREQERIEGVPPAPAEETEALVARALTLLRLPTSPGQVPELAYNTEGDGKFIGLRCPVSHRIYSFRAFRGRVLDLLEREPQLTATQRSLNTPFTSFAYDQLRDGLMAVAAPTFQEEVQAITDRLRLVPGDTVLDLCCGPGNFTVELARRVGPTGLVIGLDLSLSMLARAAYHVHAAGLGNVLLIRGDAQRLPFAAGALSRINCSGGFHQLPDLQGALQEIARVSGPGATLCASTFATEEGDALGGAKEWLRRRAALHFVSLPWLGEQLAALGFVDYQAHMHAGLFAYASAHRV